MRRQHPVNTKMRPSTPRQHAANNPVNAPSTRQHPAPSPPTPPLRSRAATGTARASRIQPPLRWRSACGRMLAACSIRMTINLAGRVRAHNRKSQPSSISADHARTRTHARQGRLALLIPILGRYSPAPICTVACQTPPGLAARVTGAICSPARPHSRRATKRIQCPPIGSQRIAVTETVGHGANTIDPTRLLALGRLISPHWEGYGKIERVCTRVVSSSFTMPTVIVPARCQASIRSRNVDCLRNTWVFDHLRGVGAGVPPNLAARRILDVLNPHAAAISTVRAWQRIAFDAVCR
jgi:hypothetical protein